MFARRISSLGLAIMLVACGGAPTAVSTPSGAASPTATGSLKLAVPQDVTLRTDFGMVWYHAPFFLALDRGYYKDLGINLTIGGGQGSTTTGKTVSTGQETFGFMNYSTMIQLVAQQADLVGVGESMQRDFFGVITLSTTGIKTPKDIEGRSGGFTAGSASQRLFPYFTSKAGVDVAKVRQVTIEGTELQALLAGRIDFYVGSAITQEPLIKEQGFTPVSIMYADFGASVNTYGLVTTNAVTTSKPDLVRAFIAASQKGVDAAVKEPEAAADALIAHSAELRGKRDLVIAQTKQLGSFLHSTHTQGKPSLCMSAESFKATIAALKQYLALTGEPDANAVFTNRFIPGGC
jgi:NitT/TauT family transport system substrate-binding protein